MKVAILVLLALFSASVCASPSKWVDSQGKVHYSDNPPKNDPKVEQLQIRDTISTQPSADSNYAPRSTAEMEADLKRSKDARSATEKKEEQARAQAQAKQINCANARANLSLLQQGGRLYKMDANGERAYMDDTQRQQQTDAAQSKVSEYCN